MAAVLSNTNVEEEYMWSCSLDKDNKEFSWMPETTTKDDKDDPKPGHRLLIKNAILMPQAEKDAVNIVQIECDGYNNVKVVTPLVVMKGQVDYQRYVDLLVPSPAKIKLISGNGPVHLTGSHCVDFYGYGGQEERDEESEEDVEMEGDGGKKEDLRNKLNEKGVKKNEAKIIETKSKSEKVDNEKEIKKGEESESGEGSKKRKASEDLKPEDEKKTKTGSVEKKEKRKSK